MKNSKRFVLALLVIAIAFTSLNIISIAKANQNTQTVCTAQGDIAPQQLDNKLAETETSNELFATMGDIKPGPWSDYYPIKKDDDSDD